MSEVARKFDGPRELLRRALVTVRDADARNREAQARLTAASAALADVSTTLESLQHDHGASVGSTVGDAHDRLQTALEALDAADRVSDEVRAECRDSLSRALALVFAAGGGPRESVPPPRRKSGRPAIVQVPGGSMHSGVRMRPTPPEDAIPQLIPPPLPPALPADTTPTIPADPPSLPADSVLGEAPPLLASALPVAVPPTLPVVDVDNGPPSETERPEVASADVAVESAPPDEIAQEEPAESEDRRSNERAILEVDVGFVSESTFFAGLSLDVSVGGLFVATYQARPVGTEFTMYFVLPGGHAVTTNGVVRWVREPSDDAAPGMGVSFVDMNPEDLAWIQRFCAKREPLYHDID